MDASDSTFDMIPEDRNWEYQVIINSLLWYAKRRDLSAEDFRAIINSGVGHCITDELLSAEKEMFSPTKTNLPLNSKK